MFRNIIANVAGRFWATLSNLIFIPLYIQILGINNFGFIAFSLIIAGMMVILDGGLSVAISREMARSDVTATEKFASFRTLETLYLGILVFGGGIAFLLAAPIANVFLDSATLDPEIMKNCLRLIFCEAALQIFFRFYVSAMMGMERQIEANLFNIGWGALRNGAVIGIIYVTPTLTAFFLWQLISTAIVLVTIRIYLMRGLGSWRPAHIVWIDRPALRRVKGFAFGIFLISIMGVVNTQSDRLVLSYLMPLDELGYYTIAVAIGTGMLAVSSPFVSAMQPRLTKWMSCDRERDAADLYLRVASLVAILMFPLMAVIGFHADTVVMAWTGNELVANGASEIVPWTISAYALLSMSSVTYSVALAHGYTRYNNIIGVVTLCVSLPGYWLMVKHFGAAGAAMLFFVIQAGVSLSFHLLIDRRFLKLGAIRSGFQLFAYPAGAAIVLTYGMSAAVAAPVESRLAMLAYLGLTYALVMGSTGLLVSAAFKLRWRRSDIITT